MPLHPALAVLPASHALASQGPAEGRAPPRAIIQFVMAIFVMAIIVYGASAGLVAIGLIAVRLIGALRQR